MAAALVAVLATTGCASASRAPRSSVLASASSDSARLERFIADYLAPSGSGRGASGRRASPLARLRVGADREAARRASMQLARLRTVDTTRLSVPQRIDWLLLEAQFRRTVYDTALRRAEREPGRYLTLGNVYDRLSGDRPPTAKDWAQIRAELTDAPTAMTLGRTQLRTPPPLWAKLAVASALRYETYLRSEFPARVEGGAPDSLRAPLLTAASGASAALGAYAAFLRDTLVAGPEGSWAAGSEYYNWILANSNFLPLTADSMIAEGRRIHAATQIALDSAAARVRPGVSWKVLAEEMRTRHPPAGQILAAYERESRNVQAYLIKKALVGLPPCQELIFVPTPPQIRDTYAWGGYGGLTERDSVQVGRFFVTDVVAGMTPEQTREKLRAQNNGWISVIALHEGYPGHHLQASYAARNPRKLRREIGNSYAAEGWALYAEHWLARDGLFAGNPDGQLAQLQMRLWRTARVIIDPSLHTGAMTYDQAVRFFVDEVGLEPSAAEAEVNRFTTWPAQAPSYIVGWLEIEKLRSELQRELGPRFDQRQFVERVLSEGALPLALLRRAVRYSYGLGG